MPARRKPLSQQRGDLTTKVKDEKLQAEQSVKTATDQILTPPDWLNSDEAKEEWHRVLPQLLEIDVVGNLDLEALAGYCNAFANYRRAIYELSQQNLLNVFEDPESGFCSVKENPLNGIAIKWAVEMRRFADTCGITINSRLKAGQAKVDKQKQTIEDEFGDI